MKPADLQTLARAALVPTRTEARQLFDAGLTVGQVAADLGVARSTAEHLARAPGPQWPVFSDEALAALPEHVRRMIQASNPNHRKA